MSSCRLLLAAIINSRPPSVPNRATCGSKTELAHCNIGLNWVIRSANAHWATPPFSERCSSLLKRVRFGYGSLINLFSTTLSIQANSRVQSLSVSAKRKPVHSFHRDVTTKSERVIAHVIGSNLLWGIYISRRSRMRELTRVTISIAALTTPPFVEYTASYKIKEYLKTFAHAARSVRRWRMQRVRYADSTTEL